MQYMGMLGLATGFLLSVTPGCSALFNAKNKTTFDLANVQFDERTYPAVIVGGGVAGLTAAIYFAQANISCLVVQGTKPGGALAQSDSVRNWPGIINAPGKQIMTALEKQVQSNGITLAHEEVTSLDTSTWPYKVNLRDTTTGAQRSVTALTIILAMGAQPNYLGIPGEQDYWGRGVTNCAVCDGALYKQKNVIVVGGGDSAVLEASYLASIAKNVTVVVRKDCFNKANDSRKRDALLKKTNVRVLFNTQLTAIQGNDQQVTSVTVIDNTTNSTDKLSVDGVFLAIGSTPNTKLVKDSINLDAAGYIALTDGPQTSQPGIFAAGDICDPVYKQAVTSAGDGCRAALQCQHLLSDIGYDPLKHPHEAVRLHEVSQEQQKNADTQNQETEEETIHSLVTEITGADQLKEVLKQKQPIILDCYTDWCHWCKVMEPTIEELAIEFAGKVNFYRLNLTTTRSFSADAPITRSIMSVPTFLFIKDGKEAHRLSGAQRPDAFRAGIKKYFGIQ